MKFYSEKLNKMFDSQEACAEAEAAHDKRIAEAEAKKKALAEDRAKRAKEVESAYEAAVTARENYQKILDSFIKDYGSFHMTVKTGENNPFNLFDSLFDSLFR